jgi:hypothetical protein
MKRGAYATSNFTEGRHTGVYGLIGTLVYRHLHAQPERYRSKDEYSVEVRYFISFLQILAAQMLKTARTHWQIENYFQWVLDLAFREDDCRIRKDNGAQSCAILLSVLPVHIVLPSGSPCGRRRCHSAVADS